MNWKWFIIGVVLMIAGYVSIFLAVDIKNVYVMFPFAAIYGWLIGDFISYHSLREKLRENNDIEQEEEE